MNKSTRRGAFRGLAALPLLPAVAAAQTPAVSDEADALTAFVRLRYGKYLSASEMAEIKGGVERMMRNAEAINRVKITNTDGPDYLFHPGGLTNDQ
jgi:hypothetical protein